MCLDTNILLFGNNPKHYVIYLHELNTFIEKSFIKQLLLEYTCSSWV